MKGNGTQVVETEQTIRKAMFNIYEDLEAQQFVFSAGVDEVFMRLFAELVNKLFHKHKIGSCPGDLLWHLARRFNFEPGHNGSKNSRSSIQVFFQGKMNEPEGRPERSYFTRIFLRH